MAIDRNAIADLLIAAYDGVARLAPITASEPDFTVDDAYAVLAIIEQRRRAQGWKPVGRKIGFTNRTIWPRYGVYQPNWAHIWSHTVQFAKEGRGTIDLRRFVNPRIEPEIAFKPKGPVPVSDDPVALLSAVEWMAPSFEIVQSHFPDWKFKLPDCTAAFGLHGALVVGPPVSIDVSQPRQNRRAAPRATVTLKRGGVSSTAASVPMYWTVLRWRSAISRACSRNSRNFRRSLPAKSSPPAPLPMPGRSQTERHGRQTTANLNLTA